MNKKLINLVRTITTSNNLPLSVSDSPLFPKGAGSEVTDSTEIN